MDPHLSSPAPDEAANAAAARGPWYAQLTREHWFVLIVAAMGWLFDTMDQQLFALARVPALRELLSEPAATPGAEALPPEKSLLDKRGGDVTAIFLMGWATGGLFFGVLGDRFGRARVMAWTILAYSACTGLSALSVGFWDFAIYRFLTGLGVGGEFAVGVALVAEVMPARARPFALALLQALSAVGNIMAALISMGLGRLEQLQMLESLGISSAWRGMFLLGALPALLVVVIRSRLKEPETWVRAMKEGQTKHAASRMTHYYAEIFGDPVLRRNAIVGLMLAFSGVVGVWGIGFFTVDLFDSVLRKGFASENLAPHVLDGRIAVWKGIVSMMQNIGAFFGMYFFVLLSQRIGRRSTFAVCLTAAGLSTAAVFAFLDSFAEVFWMVPIMGFCMMSPFGGYAVYFPELFPTRLRSTGTSFCYNVGRFVAAAGPFTLGLLASGVYAHTAAPLRYAGITMCSVFIIGLMALPFAPETKDQPLPE